MQIYYIFTVFCVYCCGVATIAFFAFTRSQAVSNNINSRKNKIKNLISKANARFLTLKILSKFS